MRKTPQRPANRARPGDPSPQRAPTLGELVERYSVVGHCPACGHATPLDLAAMIVAYGADATAFSLGPRLRCTACGRRGGSITVGPKIAGDRDAGEALARPDPLAPKRR